MQSSLTIYLCPLSWLSIQCRLHWPWISIHWADCQSNAEFTGHGSLSTEPIVSLMQSSLVMELCPLSWVSVQCRVHLPWISVHWADCESNAEFTGYGYLSTELSVSPMQSWLTMDLSQLGCLSVPCRVHLIYYHGCLSIELIVSAMQSSLVMNLCPLSWLSV